MCSHNIQFHGTMRKCPSIFVLLSYWKNFVGTKNEFQFAMVKKPSVFKLSRFDCNLYIFGHRL